MGDRPSLTCGLDMGGTKILGVVVEPATGEVVAESRIPTPAGIEAVTDALVDLAADLRDGLGADAPRLVAVGVGAPGLVDRAGMLRYGPNLPGVIDLDLAHVLRHRLGMATVADNDATCAAWGEHELGAARGRNHAVLVTLGTGIGAGIVVKGEVLRGAHGFAGEPGHMVVDPNGPPCPCGRRGCWERYTSGTGLGRLAREAAAAHRCQRVLELAGGDPEAVRGEHVTTAAREGDDEALEVLRQFAWWLALGLANVVNLLDSEVLVVGGGLIGAGELVLEPTRAAYRDLVLAQEHRPEPPIVAAVLGERAGAIGAALLAAARS